MKKMLIAMVALLLSTGCGSGNLGTLGTNSIEGGDETPQDSPISVAELFGLPDGQIAFYSFGMDVAPVVTSATATSVSKTLSVKNEASITNWSWGSPTFEIYQTFREYQNPRDDGVIDVSNMHKFLFEAGNVYDNSIQIVQELSAPKVIAPPFDFGREGRTFSYAADHYALGRSGTTTEALLSFIWDENPKFSYAVIDGSFDTTTGDLDLDFAYLVDYEGDRDYCVRTRLTGNENTHNFMLRTSKFNTGGHYAITMVGAGISESDDPDDYFLVKIMDSQSLAAFPAGRYYKFASNPTEIDLIGYPATGYALEEIDDPMGYAQIIEQQTPFALDGSDHATSVADFTNIDLHLEY